MTDLIWPHELAAAKLLLDFIATVVPFRSVLADADYERWVAEEQPDAEALALVDALRTLDRLNAPRA